MSWIEIALIVACGVLTLIPPKWDPLIRWKERNERRRRK